MNCDDYEATAGIWENRSDSKHFRGSALLSRVFLFFRFRGFYFAGFSSRVECGTISDVGNFRRRKWRENIDVLLCGHFVRADILYSSITTLLRHVLRIVEANIDVVSTDSHFTLSLSTLAMNQTRGSQTVPLNDVVINIIKCSLEQSQSFVQN